jgi:CarD family transcriptional regulator
MASRRKTIKRSSNRGRKTHKSSSKTASQHKRKAAKSSTKLEKAAAAARRKAARAKAVAKGASRAAVRSKAKVAPKRIAAAAKSASRSSVKTRTEPLEKNGKAARTAGAEASLKVSKVKESELMSSAKAKVKTNANVAVVVKNETIPGKPPIGNAGRPATPPRGEPAHPAHPHQPTKATPTKATLARATVATPAAPPVAGGLKPGRPATFEKTPLPGVAADASTPPSLARAPAPRHGFKSNEFVVYPAHGVGQIIAVEEQEVAGFSLELFVITFVKDKMTLRVPVGKAASVGMRKLSDPDLVKKSLDTLLGRARIKRTMWSRRAQEYEAKINSGDLIAIAEVVRDLYRSEAQPEQSYSERQLYEAALDRMAREVAAVQKVTESEALKILEGQLQHGQRRGKSDSTTSEPGEPDVEEAA